MKIDIDFEKLLNDSINAAINATIDVSDKNPDFASRHAQYQLIATISAHTTIQILRDYHAMLETAFQTLDTIHQ